MKITIKKQLLLLQAILFLGAPAIHSKDPGEILVNIGSAVGHGIGTVVDYTVLKPAHIVGNVIGTGASIAANYVSQKHDDVRNAVADIGVNIKQNLENPLKNAQTDIEIIDFNGFGKTVLESDDIAECLNDKDKQSKAVQAFFELIAERNTSIHKEAIDTKYSILVTQLDSELKKYKTIVSGLEGAVTQVYAEGADKRSIKTVLDQMLNDGILTKEKAFQSIERIKKDVRDRFQKKKSKAITNKIEELRTSVGITETQKKQSMDAINEQYNQQVVKVQQAIDIYTNSYLVQVKIESVLALKDKCIKKALKLNEKYKKQIKKYKTIIKKIDANKIVQHKDFKKIIDNDVKNSADIVYVIQQTLDKADQQDKTKIVSIFDEIREISEKLSKTVGKVAIFFDTYENSLTTAQVNFLDSIVQKQESADTLFALMTDVDTNIIKQIDRFLDIQRSVDLYEQVEQPKEFFAKEIKLENLTQDRSVGIKELLLQEEYKNSVSTMIKAAEKAKDDYIIRQEGRMKLIDNVFGNCVTAILKQPGHKCSTTVDCNKFVTYLQEAVTTIIEKGYKATEKDLKIFDTYASKLIKALQFYPITTQDKMFIKQVIQDAVNDAKSTIKACIVAEWTVLGIEAKLSFETLADTEGSSIEAKIKRGFGKFANTIRKGLVGFEKTIKEDNYHEKARKAIKKDAKEIAQSAALAIKKGAHIVGDKIAEDNYHQATRQEIVNNLNAAATKAGDGAIAVGDAIKQGAQMVAGKIAEDNYHQVTRQEIVDNLSAAATKVGHGAIAVRDAIKKATSKVIKTIAEDNLNQATDEQVVDINTNDSNTDDTEEIM